VVIVVIVVMMTVIMMIVVVIVRSVIMVAHWITALRVLSVGSGRVIANKSYHPA